MKPILTLLLLALLTACAKSPPEQDATHFAKWQQDGSNKTEATALQSFLTDRGVGTVLPVRQLLRSDTQWKKCGSERFAVPPLALWPHMVPTLQVIRDEVKPLIGPVEAQSVFRDAAINRCIKGASQSTHLRFHAIDMRPARQITRAELIQKLCALHAAKGRALNMGLGIYRGTRFHIDTAGYRRWGQDHRTASSPCIGFVALQRKSS